MKRTLNRFGDCQGCVRITERPRLPRDRAPEGRPEAHRVRARGRGAYGSIHVGQLRALAKTDLRPDFVVGTSVGSLNATIVAETPEIAHDRLAAFWSLVTRDDVFGSARKMMMNLSTLRPAIADLTRCAKCCFGRHLRATSPTFNSR